MLETINELLAPKPEQKKPTTNKPPEKKPQTKTTPTPQNKDTNIKAPDKIKKVDKPKVLGEANTFQPQINYDLDIKSYINSLQGLTKQIGEKEVELNKAQQEAINQISSKKGELENAFKQIDEQLKQANDIPAIKTYKEIVEENNKLVPLMAGVIALGTAIFGNKDGTTMADKMNAMFGALKEKSLTDWKTATEDFKLKLQQWKAKSENIYNRVNLMMQKLMLGEKIDDELAKFKVDFANTNLNNVLALYKTTADMLKSIEQMQMNAQFKTMQLGLMKQRNDIEYMKGVAYSQERQSKTEKTQQQTDKEQKANYALTRFLAAYVDGNEKEAEKWSKAYHEITGHYPPQAKNTKNIIGVPKPNTDTKLLTQGQ
jgi:hypothetical protein